MRRNLRQPAAACPRPYALVSSILGAPVPQPSPPVPLKSTSSGVDFSAVGLNPPSPRYPHPVTAQSTAAVWLNPDQLDLLQAVAELAGLNIVSVGTGHTGQSSRLAEALGPSVAPLDDLRGAVASVKTDLLLLLASDQLGSSRPAEDADLLRDCQARSVRVASLEPVPAALLELAAGAHDADFAELRGAGAALARWSNFVPLSRATKALRDAADVIAQFGPVRSASIECLGAPAHGSLGSRLLDAMDLALNLVGEPETIDASFLGAHAGQAVHTLPGETLRALQGDLTAHLRFADGRACSILASNQAGRWERVITLIGPGGRLRIYNDGFEWIGIGGERVDQSRPRRSQKPAFKPPTTKAAETDAPSGAAAAIAEQIATLLRVGSADTGSSSLDLARVLALGQTALLSARTGEGESPSTILRMAGV